MEEFPFYESKDQVDATVDPAVHFPAVIVPEAFFGSGNQSRYTHKGGCPGLLSLCLQPPPPPRLFKGRRATEVPGCDARAGCSAPAGLSIILDSLRG